MTVMDLSIVIGGVILYAYATMIARRRERIVRLPERRR